MNRTENNGPKGSTVIEPTVEQDSPRKPEEAQGDGAKQPYIPADGKKKSSLRDNTRVLAIGGGIAAVLLILILRGIPHQPLALGKRGGVNKQQAAKPPDNGATTAYSVLPLMDSGRRPDESADKSMVRPDEIARTASKQPQLPAGANLAGIPPFGNLTKERLDFVYHFAFPPSHIELLPVRESKRERAAYEAQMTEDKEDIESPLAAFGPERVGAGCDARERTA